MRLDWPGLLLLLIGLLAVACETGGGFGDSGFSVGFDSGARCDTAGGGADTRYADVDGDGYGDADAALNGCSAPDDFVENGDDCNDGEAGVNPAATDVCGDGVDQDCSGDDAVCDTGE